MKASRLWIYQKSVLVRAEKAYGLERKYYGDPSPAAKVEWLKARLAAIEAMDKLQKYRSEHANAA